MIISGISDLHGNLIETVPKCDVLCICGDIINLNDQRNIESSRIWFKTRFLQWAIDLKCKKILVVPGNHDFYISEVLYNGWSDLKELEDASDGKIKFLIDESFTINGIKFYGTPWVAQMWPAEKWCFELNSSKYNDPVFKYNIPSDTDVLITHDNPNMNLALFYELAEVKNLKAHLFGHWHDGISYGDLNQYNCSILDDNYNHRKRKHVVTINIEDRKEFEPLTAETLNEVMDDIIESRKNITTG